MFCTEHSGLGRYGDPLNPFGDILESQKVSCLLKVGETDCTIFESSIYLSNLDFSNLSFCVQQLY